MPSFHRYPSQRRQSTRERRPRLLRDVLYLMDHEGMVFVPYEKAALLRDEGTGRLEVTAVDGRVAHRAGSIEQYAHGPWIQIAPGVLAHPDHARREGRELVFPGGWRIAFRGSLPKARPVPEAIVERIGVTRGEVLYLQPGSRKPCDPSMAHSVHGAQWVTDRGPIPVQAASLREAAGQHGGLIQVGHRWVNPRRLRAVRPDKKYGLLVLDDGSELKLGRCANPMLLRALGIASFSYLLWKRPEHVGLYTLGLRDFPFEIAEASGEVLRETFGRDERRLVANLAWQACRYRRAGRAADYGDGHRAFWYRPLLPVLVRAGMLRPPSPEEIVSLSLVWMSAVAAPLTAADHYRYFMITLAKMVETYRLLTFTDLGFRELHPELRRIGGRRPGVVLAVEKGSAAEFAWALADRFGISVMILDSQPPLVGTEFFAKALKAAFRGKVRLVAYVDYDPGGWVVANAFRQQLALFGVAASEPRFLVRPSRFTAEELQRYASRLEARSRSMRTRARSWVEASGGIHGKALGIHLDHLRPLERVIQAFVEETGLRAGGRIPIVRAARFVRRRPCWTAPLSHIAYPDTGSTRSVLEFHPCGNYQGRHHAHD